MIKKQLTYLTAGLVMLLSSCVRSSGDSECPSYVKFVYNYNMAFEDLFHNQACKMDLYLFDDNGIFIDRLSHEISNGGTFARDFVMRLPDNLPHPLHMVAWSGLHEDFVSVTTLTKNVSTIDELAVSINDNQEKISDMQLRGLWHGTVVKEKENNLAIDYTTIHLTKNTNKVRIVLQCINEAENFDVDDFSFTLDCVNASYDHKNGTESGSECWTYIPCHTENDPNSGAIAELHTLRLLEDRDNRFIIQHKDENEPLLDINLNNYINALKMSEYSRMPLQEYMDREDEYRIIILVKYDEGEKTYVIINITVNDWYVRTQYE